MLSWLDTVYIEENTETVMHNYCTQYYTSNPVMMYGIVWTVFKAIEQILAGKTFCGNKCWCEKCLYNKKLCKMKTPFL